MVSDECEDKPEVARCAEASGQQAAALSAGMVQLPVRQRAREPLWVFLDGAAPDAHFQLHAVIDNHPPSAARTQRYSRKVYRDVGGSTRDGSDYYAVEIDRGVFHAARRRETLLTAT
jgi:hypothetical protein